MVEKDRQSDIVDEAFETLRRAQPSEGPSLQALEQTLQAVHQAQQKSNRISLLERIRNVNKLIKYPVAAAITIAALAAGAYLLLGRGAGIAFADVRHQIEQAQTMTMTAASEMKGMKKPLRMKMFFKYPGLMRQEMTIEPETFAGFMGTSKPSTMPSQQVISIFDLSKLRALNLVPSQKKAIVMEFKDLPADMAAKLKEQDMLGSLKKAVAGEHEDLGEKTINGVKAKGYRCKKADMHQVTMEIWVDASTGVPVWVEQQMPEAFGGIKVTMTDFVINPKLDDSLFDTNPPAGYSVENQTATLNVSEQDLLRALNAFVTYLGGDFPKSLMPTPELMKQIIQHVKEQKAQMAGAHAKKPTSQQLQEEGKQFGMQIQKIMMFQIKTMGDGEFVYAGEGVKLGDKATPILWYKAKDAKKYRVIYGDLHAEDAEKAPKHSASQPQRHLVPIQPATGPR